MRSSHPARGLGSLVFDAVERLTDVVESMHLATAGTVYGHVRRGTRLVRTGTEAVLDRLRLPDPPVTSDRWTGFVSALNGIVGDHLAASGNPLAITMSLRHGGHALPDDPAALPTAVPGATDRVLLLVHGLCMSDRQWTRDGHDHGLALGRDHGWTPVYVRHNSGRHVSENGRELAMRLERLLAAWPRPVAELAILAHSQGGLVTRSACHYATEAELTWPRTLRRIVFLGTPHHGAPLERAGSWLQAAVAIAPESAPLSRLGALRSAGVTDLRHGSLLDEDWAIPDRTLPALDRRRPVPLPPGVACWAVAGTTGAREGDVRDRVLGDGLVPIASALGRHRDPARTLAFPETHQWIVPGVGHLELLSHPAVYARLHRWLG